jgi:hypothetical protein
MTERSLTIRWEEPQPRTATRHLSGREYLQAMIDGRIPPSPMAQLLGFEITEVGDGFVVATCVPGEKHYNATARTAGSRARSSTPAPARRSSPSSPPATRRRRSRSR